MIRIRSCATMAELDAVVQLQIETWGYEKTDVIPRKTFLLAQKIGGQLLGAFDSEEVGDGAGEDGRLVGFAMSLPGIQSTPEGPRAYLHSHMLAVRRSHRNRGLGARLKWEQRREALRRKILHMEWTFDPLEIKNAYLNLHKLGVIVRQYRVNFYGPSSSPLQGGLPTDRLLAEWELASPRVCAREAEQPWIKPAIEERIVVPASISEWKADSKLRERALAVQQENQRRLMQAFRRGLVVVDFSIDDEGNGIYELSAAEQP